MRTVPALAKSVAEGDKEDKAEAEKAEGDKEEDDEGDKDEKAKDDSEEGDGEKKERVKRVKKAAAPAKAAEKPGVLDTQVRSSSRSSVLDQYVEGTVSVTLATVMIMVAKRMESVRLAIIMITVAKRTVSLR